MKQRSARQFLGRWRILTMQQWDRDYLDLEVPAHLAFDGKRLGSFQFGTVRGWIDYRVAERAGKPFVEFSWEGFDDSDPGCGRGWASIDGDEMEGWLYIHNGDDSAFTARRESSTRVSSD